jgi:hypothetical protein
VEEAKAAMTRALAEDPDFVEAQAALGDLENLLRQREAERQGARKSARDLAYDALLKEVPEDRARPADFVYDQEALTLFALRLGILEEQRRDCDRYAEMRHYLERVGWNVAEPPRKPTDVGVLGYAIGKVAQARGLDVRNEDPATPEYLRPTLPNRVAGLFRNTPTFVFEGESIWKRGHGLMGSLLVCFSGKEALKEIDALIASAPRRSTARC